MKLYRVGIVGLGRIASLYRKDVKARRCYPTLTHADAYAQHPRTKVVAACDVNAARLREFGGTWGVRSLYRDAARMLADEKLDVLSVCTAPESHLPVVRLAAGRVPMIFCEKPMGRNLREAQAIERACRLRGSRLMVNVYRLFDPAHRELGRRLAAGELGRIQRVNAYYGKGLRNMGAHVMSLLLRYFGPISSVRALTAHSFKDGKEATVDFTAQFKAGFPAVLQGCDFSKYRIFELDIIGENGRVVLDREGFGFRFFRVKPNRAESGARELRPAASPIKATVGRAFYWAAHNIVSVLDGTAKPLSSGHDYLETEKVLAAALESAGLQGKAVAV